VTEPADRALLRIDEDGLAHLRLTRAAKHNAIDAAMVEAFARAVIDLERAEGVRAVLLAADGPSFTVGGDLPFIAAHSDRLAATLDDMIGRYHDALGRLAALPAPVVAAVQGPAAGGGLGIVWAADLVLAGEDLKIATGFARLGLSGDGGSSWWLPRLVGLRRAQELLIAGRVLDAAEALEWGLVTRVLPVDRLAAEAEELARRLAAGPTRAYAHMGALLRDGATRTLEQGLAAERRAMVDTGATADAVEGVAAFVERRPPGFRGR
jgi:2-(1,2-epoxy-1,2-dihydrophenyl)acetyl-CoA isomerase